ncbi:glycosyltransferase [Prochlorothrix hollandica]|uniref:glycosyltransferase n=1 Tax=Prochlorothrix hollandica TaxID=1223 RepID=UPI00034D377A|nr:glycosyltransferase [Prochlorothrix hollandica]
MKVLHITPHLGGGVGKAVSGLVQEAQQTLQSQHSIICLEKPEKTYFADKIISLGVPILFAPSYDLVCQAVKNTDIVQIEFWNHPALLAVLCQCPLPSMRLLVWCHISGLFYPQIPLSFIQGADKFIYTSPCSLTNRKLFDSDSSCYSSHIHVVSSAGGIEDLPISQAAMQLRQLKGVYVGSLNFAKLHPRVVDYLSVVQDFNFSVSFIGDNHHKRYLQQQCEKINRPNLLSFYGYSQNIAKALSEFNLFVYFLNPKHYGTAENSLIESMAMGLVPLVLKNRAECCIVQHQVTGFHVESPQEVAYTLRDLADDFGLRVSIAQNCINQIRSQYSFEISYKLMYGYYSNLMDQAKREIDFTNFFGQSPSDWFSSFNAASDGFELFGGDGSVHLPEDESVFTLMEETKGSVFHFSRYFPGDLRLREWSSRLLESRSKFVDMYV